MTNLFSKSMRKHSPYLPIWRGIHCLKSIRIWSYSGPHFRAFGLNTESYEVSLRIQSECEKMRTRINPNKDTFYAVIRTLFPNNIYF